MKIFLSSVQKEFAAERKALAAYLSGDPMLRRFFDAFRRKKPELGAKSRLDRDQVAGQVAGQVTGQVGPQLKSRLESRLESALAAKVVLAIREEPLGKASLAPILGHKTVSGELHKQIKRLVDTGIIELTIPEKPTSRLQKYRLTEKGRRLLEKLEKGKGRS